MNRTKKIIAGASLSLLILAFILLDGLFLTVLFIAGPMILIIFLLAVFVKDRSNGLYHTNHKKYG